MNKYFIIVLLAYLINLNLGFSQESEDSHHNHLHSNEISVASGAVYIPDEDEVTVKFHMHYIRGLGENKRFGIGIGLETIIDEHNHNTISVVTHYRLVKGLIIGYAPGILFVKSESETEIDFSQHFETAYEFELGNFLLGPVLELGVDSEEIHYMVGAHIGIDF